MDIPCDKFKEKKGNTIKKTILFRTKRQNCDKNKSTKTSTQNSDPLVPNTEDHGAFAISTTYRLGPGQITQNDGMGNIQYERPLQEPTGIPGVDDAAVDVHIPNAVPVFQSLKRMALVGLLLAASIIAAVVAVSVLLTRPVTSPVETLTSSLSPNLSPILPETPIFNPTSSPSTGLLGSVAENTFNNQTVSVEPSAPPIKAMLSPETSALPSQETRTDEPSAKPSVATVTDEPSAKPSVATVTDEPSAKPSPKTTTDAPTVPPSKATISEKPTSPPTQTIISVEPTAPPSEATCIFSSSTEAKVCLLFDGSWDFYYEPADNLPLAQQFAQAIVIENNKTSTETLYSSVTFGRTLVAAKTGYWDATNTLTYISEVSVTTSGIQNPHVGFSYCQENLNLDNGETGVIIIFTNGVTENAAEADNVTSAIKASGIKIVCLGFGKLIEVETLTRWSTTPNLYFEAEDFYENQEITSEFTDKISCV